MISQHHLYAKWEAFEGRRAEGIFLNMPSVLQIAPESCSQVQTSALCCLLLGKASCALCLQPRSFRKRPVDGKGSALGSGWSMVQTTEFSCQSETTAWSSSSCSLCPISAQIPGLQTGGTSWYGQAREDEESPLPRGRCDLGKGVPRSVMYWPWSSSLPFTGLVGSWGAREVSREVACSRGLPEQCNKRGVQHFKQKVAFCSSFLCHTKPSHLNAKGPHSGIFAPHSYWNSCELGIEQLNAFLALTLIL